MADSAPLAVTFAVIGPRSTMAVWYRTSGCAWDFETRHATAETSANVIITANHRSTRRLTRRRGRPVGARDTPAIPGEAACVVGIAVMVNERVAATRRCCSR